MGRKILGLITALAMACMALAPGLAQAEDAPKPGMALFTELMTAINNNERGPNVDPLAEASCSVDKGWIAIYISFIIALHEKRTEGSIAKDVDRQLSTWLLDLNNYIIDTADVEGTCRQMVAGRKAHGF